MSDFKKDRQKLLYYFYVVFMNLSMVSMVMNLYFKYLGFSFTQIGILFSFLQIGKMVFEIPTGFIADRYGNRSSLLLSFALQMSGYLLMANPASMTSTPRISSCRARRIFSLRFMVAPGDCSPSRNVVSKKNTLSIFFPLSETIIDSRKVTTLPGEKDAGRSTAFSGKNPGAGTALAGEG